MPGKHSRVVNGVRHVWWTERLWQLSSELPVESIPLSQIAEFDQNCWFDAPPTCRQVAQHLTRIQEADLSFPIILSADGFLMDGGHRVCKAFLTGRTHIASVRFRHDLAPDFVVPADAAPLLENAIVTVCTESPLPE